MSILSSLGTMDSCGSALLPVHAGIGLKPAHFKAALEHAHGLGFFEVHAENYMIEGGPLHHYLNKIREHYPLSIHGVALSIGSEDPIDRLHLKKLKSLVERYEPALVSEHLAWSSHGDFFFNDLLPVAYDARTLQRVCEHIDYVQSHLKRPLLLENPSTYLEFHASTMTEAEFISTIVQRTGCGLLLDVNNVYVSCMNHNRNPHTYLAGLPLDKVGEIHLAGFAAQTDAADAALLIDTHGAPVAQDVWNLYAQLLKQTGAVPTLIERDNDVPEFDVLVAEAMLAANYLSKVSP